jgi:hypothetical protein
MTTEADKAGKAQEGESGSNVTDWQEYLSELHVKLYTIVARDNYPYKGKGVVVVDLNTVLPKATLVEYQTLDDPVIKKHGGPGSQVPDFVDSYDPEKELVILLIAPNDEGCDAHDARMRPRPCHEEPIQWSACRCDAHAMKIGALPVKQIYEASGTKLVGETREHLGTGIRRKVSNGLRRLLKSLKTTANGANVRLNAIARWAKRS